MTSGMAATTAAPSSAITSIGPGLRCRPMRHRLAAGTGTGTARMTTHFRGSGRRRAAAAPAPRCTRSSRLRSRCLSHSRARPGALLGLQRRLLFLHLLDEVGDLGLVVGTGEDGAWRLDLWRTLPGGIRLEAFLPMRERGGSHPFRCEIADEAPLLDLPRRDREPSNWRWSLSTSGPAKPQSKMSFFITSANPGKGGDRRTRGRRPLLPEPGRQSSAQARRSWRAYLSTTATAGGAPVNARDRIGKGPWVNRERRDDRQQHRRTARAPTTSASRPA